MNETLFYFEISKLYLKSETSAIHELHLVPNPQYLKQFPGGIDFKAKFRISTNLMSEHQFIIHQFNEELNRYSQKTNSFSIEYNTDFMEPMFFQAEFQTLSEKQKKIVLIRVIG
jgi:hypothetical protein